MTFRLLVWRVDNDLLDRASKYGDQEERAKMQAAARRLADEERRLQSLEARLAAAERRQGQAERRQEQIDRAQERLSRELGIDDAPDAAGDPPDA